MIPVASIISVLTNKTVLISIFVVSVVGYVWFLRASNEALEKENRQLIVSVEAQHKTIEKLKEDVKLVVKAKDEIAAEKEKIEKSQKKLEETLYRENKNKKSLEELALKKTTLIQKKVNAATKEVFECFELISRGGDC